LTFKSSQILSEKDKKKKPDFFKGIVGEKKVAHEIRTWSEEKGGLVMAARNFDSVKGGRIH